MVFVPRDKIHFECQVLLVLLNKIGHIIYIKYKIVYEGNPGS